MPKSKNTGKEAWPEDRAGYYLGRSSRLVRQPFFTSAAPQAYPFGEPGIENDPKSMGRFLVRLPDASLLYLHLDHTTAFSNIKPILIRAPGKTPRIAHDTGGNDLTFSLVVYCN